MSASSPAAPAPEEARTVAANLHTGSRLFASAMVFVFVSFVFAFFYLKTVNSNGDFHPAHVNPQQGYGIAILVCVLAAAGVLELARRQLATGAESAWRSGAIAALAVALIVVVLQVIEYANLPFHTVAGGYASVFWGWTLAFLLFWLGAAYWIETLVAQTLRRSSRPAEGDGRVTSDVLGPSAAGCVVVLYTLAGAQVVSYVLLYLIK
jgi:heme/copper-type cytochrome/quinol oxidase subunit 3